MLWTLLGLWQDPYLFKPNDNSCSSYITLTYSFNLETSWISLSRCATFECTLLVSLLWTLSVAVCYEESLWKSHNSLSLKKPFRNPCPLKTFESTACFYLDKLYHHSCCAVYISTCLDSLEGFQMRSWRWVEFLCQHYPYPAFEWSSKGTETFKIPTKSRQS